MHDADRRQGRLRLHGPTEGKRDCPCAVAEESLDPGSRHRDRPAGRAALAAAVNNNASRDAVVALFAWAPAIATIARDDAAIVGICTRGIYSLLDQKHSRKDPCAFQSSPGAGPGSEPRSRAGWQPRMSA